MNKKGNFRDIPEYLRGALLLGITILLVSTMLFNINTRIQAVNETSIPAQAKLPSSNLSSKMPIILDMLFPVVFLIYFIFSIVMARLIPSSPKFIIIAIIYLISMPILSMILENIWAGFISSTKLAVGLNQLTYTPYMLNHLAILSIFYVGGVAIALYTKDN